MKNNQLANTAGNEKKFVLVSEVSERYCFNYVCL